MYCGCPSISTSTPAVGAPPMPRILIPPAAPAATPYPIIPLCEINSPGTSSVSRGRREGCILSAIFSSEITVMLIGTFRRFTFGMVPVTITSSRRTVSFLSAGCLFSAGNGIVASRHMPMKTMYFFILSREI